MRLVTPSFAYGFLASVSISTILRAGMELSYFLPESGAIGVLGRGPVTEYVLDLDDGAGCIYHGHDN